jgi:hypothetical protein
LEIGGGSPKLFAWPGLKPQSSWFQPQGSYDYRYEHWCLSEFGQVCSSIISLNIWPFLSPPCLLNCCWFYQLKFNRYTLFHWFLPGNFSIGPVWWDSFGTVILIL